MLWARAAKPSAPHSLLTSSLLVSRSCPFVFCSSPMDPAPPPRPNRPGMSFALHLPRLTSMSVNARRPGPSICQIAWDFSAAPVPRSRSACCCQGGPISLLGYAARRAIKMHLSAFMRLTKNKMTKWHDMRSHQ